MAQEYKITQISAEAPREWQGPKGTVYYIKVKLEGHPKPVSIGKRSPDSLRVGDSVYGTITSDPNRNEDKFKAEQQVSSGYSPSTKTVSGKTFDDRTMYVSYAKDLAVALVANGAVPGTDDFTEHMAQLVGGVLGAADMLQGKKELAQAQVDEDVAAAIEMFKNEERDEEF
jgi:hypothetical protein